MEPASDALPRTRPPGVRILVRVAAAVGFAMLFLALGTLFSSESASADEQPALISDLVDAAVPDFVAEPLAPVTDPVLALVDPIVTPVAAPVLEPVLARVVAPIVSAAPAPVIEPVEIPVLEPLSTTAVPVSVSTGSTTAGVPVSVSTGSTTAGVPVIEPLSVIEPVEIPAAPDPGNNPATVGGAGPAVGAADIQSSVVLSTNGDAQTPTPESDTPAPFPSFDHDSSPD